MARTRRRFDANIKAKIALDALRELRTVSEIAKQYRARPNQVTLWKKQLLTSAAEVFEPTGGKSARATSLRRANCTSRSAG